MSNCQTCGRDEGHYLGCAETAKTAPMDPAAILGVGADALCAQPGCENPRRPKGKGRAPIYCEDHGDPKNRM